MILPQIATHSPVEVTPETELEACLDLIHRVADLPFWIEEATGHMPTDAELLSWNTVADVLRWVEARERVGV